MPEILLKPELDRVSEVTVKCLDQLLEKHAPKKSKYIINKDVKMEGTMEMRRKIMATAHNVRVKALIDSIGYDDALIVGRKALFKAGLKLGREAKNRLGVGNSPQDLIRAARILYRVLGIDFKVEESGDKIAVTFEKCSLSNYYEPETCRILSAADEGVVQGLNENISMKFIERMTEGRSECVACLKQRNIIN